MTPSRLASRAAFGAALFLPALCFAHVGADAGAHHGAVAAWGAGFVHPLTGLDHLSAMLVLGVWSALSTRRVWLAPLVFAATLAFGSVLGMTGLALPGVEPMIAASLLVLGLLLATGTRLSALAGAAAALFALFHGAAHGQEFAAGGDAWFAIVGMVMSSALLHGVGIALGRLLRQRDVWPPRIAGAAVALFGAVLLGQLA